MSRKVNLYIAMSLDGYIAKKDDNIDFLSIVDAGDEDYGYSEFTQDVDTVIWGRKTYDKVIAMGGPVPHEDKKVYVISRTRQGSEGHVTFHPDVAGLIATLRSEEGKNIYCDGGGEVVRELLSHGLIDRIIVSIIPHLLGEGLRLFREQPLEQKLKFKRSVSYPSGLVQLWYDVLKETPGS